jgi:hypothetical protein
MKVKLPPKLCKMEGSRSMRYATPDRATLKLLEDAHLFWSGGNQRADWHDDWPIERPIALHEVDAIVEPITIYGPDEDVALFKLKYF